jgi:hypothetical protein
MKTTEEILQAIAESGLELFLSATESTLILDNAIGRGASTAWHREGVMALEEKLKAITGVEAFTTVPGYAEVYVSQLPEGFVDAYKAFREMSPDEHVDDFSSTLTAFIYAKVMNQSPWSKLITPAANMSDDNLGEPTQIPLCPTLPSESTP